MASSVQSDNKEEGIRAFEEVLEKVRQRHDKPLTQLDHSVVPPLASTRTDDVSTSEHVTPVSSFSHPVIPPVSGHHGDNKPQSIPTHPSFDSAHSIHSTEAATSAMSPFQRQLPFDAEHQSHFSPNIPYGMYPGPMMNHNVQPRALLMGGPDFQRQMTPRYHTMQPWNYIRSSTSTISSTPSLAFSEISHHVETRTVRSPGCQSTSDSSLQGDAGSGPLPDERKARNRVAAMKCRAKKLEQIRRLEKRVTDLRNLNMDLQRQVISLRGEIQSLHYICLQHRNSGCRI